MDCRMTRGIYLRANGEINCYCSTGEQISLDTLPLEGTGWDFVGDHYLQGQFDHLRESFVDDRLPFPDQCAKCNYLNTAGTFNPELVEREVEWAHIEACAVCNLRCPYCVHGKPLNERHWQRSKPHFLPRELYSKMLDDLVARKMNIKWMYFSGRGEPGLHPELWDMVAEAKEKMDTNFLVNTNGNIPFDERIVTSGLDKIKIALDSLDPEVYARYRKGGDVQKLLDLTERIVAFKKKLGSSTPEVIWQKVLMNYNDSPEELAEYQKKALECGVDSIRFVYTYTSDFTQSSPDSLERIFPKIDIFDGRDRSVFTEEKIERVRAEAEKGSGPGPRFACIKQILQWFEQGFENRENYDEYARIGLNDPMLYTYRRDDPLFVELMNVLQEQFLALSRLYGERGLTEETRRYARCADTISTLKLS